MEIVEGLWEDCWRIVVGIVGIVGRIVGGLWWGLLGLWGRLSGGIVGIRREGNNSRIFFFRHF